MTPRRGRPSERIMTENAGRRTDLRGQARLVSPRRQRESDLCDRPASEGSPLPASAGGRASSDGIEPSGFARSVSARHRPAGGTPAVMKKEVQS